MYLIIIYNENTNTLVTFSDWLNMCDVNEIQRKRRHKRTIFGDLKYVTLDNCVCFREMISTSHINNGDAIFISNNQLLEVYAKICKSVFVEIQFIVNNFLQQSCKN